MMVSEDEQIASLGRSAPGILYTLALDFVFEQPNRPGHLKERGVNRKIFHDLFSIRRAGAGRREEMEKPSSPAGAFGRLITPTVPAIILCLFLDRFQQSRRIISDVFS
jgi:hypothetical protein